jgi:hypothetical protein
MNWDEIVAKVKPYIVKIETPSGSGTGFLCLYNEAKKWCGVATALHVVNDADDWQQPIRIRHLPSSEIFLKESQRVIFPDWKTDSAIILFEKPEKSALPEDLIGLQPLEKPLDIGFEVGWLGFPYIEPFTLCFFSGCISARREDRKAYLIDGVSINGVSGGPVFYSTSTEGVKIVGIVSAYQANRATGTTLPGLLIAQDVSHFHDVIKHIKSIDEARKKKQELKEEEKSDKPNSSVKSDSSPDVATSGQ